ncbi:tetratricopeptide repeat protein [Arsenicicoccus sp. oral taxon 190]|uniref:tetratricopeptide repeat protein n=1 Tax=Arsenicicoccus sp. oral taxon 190 TaxID=1658671 RepID=UPI00067A2003|nr:hypothetical protein [Arsenicicoccus sp. oral taxon 190]AKT51008.1 hypothetical protein ADJ73_06210 [Arsenicicoccus sp. oral taxon 190]
MTQRTATTTPPTESGDLRQALLASLGLPADATPEAVEAAHQRVASYLTAAPAELSGWAGQQAAAADAAHAVLTGRAGDVLGRRAAPAPRPRRELPRIVTVLGSVALIAAIVVGVYLWGPGRTAQQTKPAVAMGDQSASGQGEQKPQATPTPVDPAKVKALEGKIAANPKDESSLAQLGDLYFAADNFAKATEYRTKLLTLKPDNTDVLLSVGVAMFNNKDLAGAERMWNKAVSLDPKKVEAYYDLGFLAISKTPPDAAKAKAMWDKVVELDPTSALAQKVQNHMSALVTPAPTAAPTTSSK